MFQMEGEQDGGEVTYSLLHTKTKYIDLMIL